MGQWLSDAGEANLVFISLFAIQMALIAIWLLTIVSESPVEISFYEAPYISEGYVTWLEEFWGQSERGFRVMVKDLDSERIYDLSEKLACNTDDVTLDGEWVVAELICPSEWNSIHAYHLESDEYIEIAPFSLDPLTQDFQPAAADGHVVWVHATESQRDIYLYDLETRIKTQVTDDTEWENHPDISGDWIVWEDYALDIYAYNIRTSERVTVTNDIIPQQWPRIDGDLLVWEDRRNGDWDIYGFNLVTREEIPLIVEEGDQTRGLPSGDILSYVHCPNQPSCFEVASIRALNLTTGEQSLVHAFEEDEYYAPEQYHGDMVWVYDPSSGTNQIRLANYLRNQTVLPIIFTNE
jgi:beta propeller repeat protein